MRVYHMSQTLKPGDTLRPDFQRCRDLAMPFVRALMRGEDCFYAMVYGGQYLRAIFDHSRLTREWVDEVKWATEGIFEYIRLREYPDRISRLNCNYYFDDLDTLKVLFQYDWGSEPEEAAKVHIYAMELPEEEPQYCDMRLFDEAYDAMEKGQDLNTALQCARRYFASARTSEPVMELLSEKSAVITGEMTQLHEELVAQCRTQEENKESAQVETSRPNPAGQ